MVTKKKLLDLTKYRVETKETPKGVVDENNKAKSAQKKMKLAANTLIKNEDGNEMPVREWGESLEDGESTLVQCPISPESHSNGDANPSCSMQRNGDYLNLKCFGCGQSAYYSTVKSNVPKKDKKDFDYTVPSFDKEEALQNVRKNLVNIDDIVAEIIRFLPPLEKKLKEEK